MTVKLVIKNEMMEFTKVVREISEIGALHAFDQGMINDLTLILEEVISNIIIYGYEDAAVHDIEVSIAVEQDLVHMTVIDDGKPFNPVKAELPDLDVPLEDRDDGGLGIFLVKKLSDDVEYARRTDKNRLTIIKKIGK